jgi:hypothetical protein
MQPVKKVEKKQSQESILSDDTTSIPTKHDLAMTETNVNMELNLTFLKHLLSNIKIFYAKHRFKISLGHTPILKIMQYILTIPQIFLTHILFLSPIELHNLVIVRLVESRIISLIVLVVLTANIATNVLFLKIFTVAYTANLVATVTAVSGQQVVSDVMTVLDVLI